MTHRECELSGALSAIRARIQGEWDNPALLEYGPLSSRTVNLDRDILYIIEQTLPEEVIR